MKKALVHIMIMSILCASMTTHAYWWRFNNFTNKTLLLKVKLLASNNPYYALVHPEMSALFDWSIPNPMSGFCFEKVEWTEVTEDLLSHKDMIDDNYQLINNKKLHLLFSGNDPVFTLQPATLEYATSELYDTTVKTAQKTFAGLGKAIKWVAKKMYYSPCRSRDISIIEDDQNILHFIASPK